MSGDYERSLHSMDDLKKQLKAVKEARKALIVSSFSNA